VSEHLAELGEIACCQSEMSDSREIVYEVGDSGVPWSSLVLSLKNMTE
jgi:hypothetical protein